MIQLVGVEKRFGPKLLFEGLSWHVRKGERIGLVGPNGAGKTTLLQIMAGTLETDAGQVVRTRGVRVGMLEQEHDFTSQRSVLEEVERASPELREVIGRLAEVEAQLEGANDAMLERYGVLRDRFEALGGYRAETQAKQVLCGLGFKESELTDPASRFSGGWRMRIALARLLLSEPDVLLLDEPTNHLDLESLAWLEGHLQVYQGAIVTVSHDRYFLNRTVKHIADLTPRGVRTYTGSYDDFTRQLEEEQSQLEKRQKQQQTDIAKAERFIERFRSKNTKATLVQSKIKALEKIERIEIHARPRAMRGFHFPQPGRSGRFVVEMKQVKKAYGDNVVYESLDLTIERGQRIALVGVNGAGKTTLLRMLAGTEGIEGGTLKLGHNVDVGYFAQHQLESLNPEASVMQEMEEVADLETYRLIRGLLGAFLFSGDDVDKPVAVLSGGEKARLAICRLLLFPCALLLLDEPTSHLDLTSRESLEDALQRYQGTLVVVSHDRFFINAVCNHVLEVYPGGEVRWYPGNYDEYLWKKAREAAELAELAPEPGADTEESEGDARARKRREAEERQRIYRATRELKKQLDSVEAEIETGEARMAEIDTVMGDAAIYQQPGKAQALGAERRKVEARVGAAYERWEVLEADIETATESARSS